MPTNRLIAILALALASATTAFAQAPPENGVPQPPLLKKNSKEAMASRTAPEVRIDEAIKILKALPSASADLRISADMLNQKFSIRGKYLKGDNHKVSLMLTLVGLGDAKGTMQQICDGVSIYDYTKILDAQRCDKLTIKPVVTALDKPEVDEEFREIILSNMGLVGPEALLSGLRRSFVFDTVRETLYEGKEVYIFGGSWKEAEVPIGPNNMTFSPYTPLPPYIPGIVFLTLGKNDWWPHKVEFEGRLPAQIEKQGDERQVGPDGRPLGRKLTGPSGRPSKITLSYANVDVTTKVPDTAFVFIPPEGVRPIDQTDATVTRLDRLITDLAARKKAEAAKAAPTLEGGLSAPPPTGDGAAPLPTLIPK